MTKDAKLTDLERMALDGLEARQRLIGHEQNAINEALAELRKFVEERVRLEPGAIGTTHQVNSRTWEVEAVPQVKEWGDPLETNAAAANGGETS